MKNRIYVVYNSDLLFVNPIFKLIIFLLIEIIQTRIEDTVCSLKLYLTFIM